MVQLESVKDKFKQGEEVEVTEAFVTFGLVCPFSTIRTSSGGPRHPGQIGIIAAKRISIRVCRSLIIAIRIISVMIRVQSMRVSRMLLNMVIQIG